MDGAAFHLLQAMTERVQCINMGGGAFGDFQLIGLPAEDRRSVCVHRGPDMERDGLEAP